MLKQRSALEAETGPLLISERRKPAVGLHHLDQAFLYMPILLSIHVSGNLHIPITLPSLLLFYLTNTNFYGRCSKRGSKIPFLASVDRATKFYAILYPIREVNFTYQYIRYIYINGTSSLNCS